MEPYNKLASIYDGIEADEHSLRMADYCREIFRRFVVRPTCGLDLCCGTGTALVVFSDWGIKMSGLDRSKSMLSVAARKTRGRGIPLYRMSLPTFRIPEPATPRKTRQFDVITCFYDSLNYLSSARQLQTAFRSVYRHLRPAGWFIFDMNTPEALRTIWGGQVYADARQDVAWVWKNEYFEGRQAAACHATCFVKEGRMWKRFDETHVETAWDNATIRERLVKSGLIIRGFYRCFTFRKPTAKTNRICGIAQRPAL